MGLRAKVCGPCKLRSQNSKETFAIQQTLTFCKMEYFERRWMSRGGFPRPNAASTTRQIAQQVRFPIRDVDTAPLYLREDVQGTLDKYRRCSGSRKRH